MSERVLLPQTPSSVLYHAPDCRMFDRRRAVELARADAEDIGRRPAPCLRSDDAPDAPDDPPEVAA
mgnify:CR=1 FL=1